MKSMQRRGSLIEDEKLGPFPMHRFRHVKKPTNLVTDNIQRIDYRENALSKAARGDYGPAVQRESPRSQMKHPVCASLVDTLVSLSSIHNNDVAASKAPLPEDPAILSHHIKRLGYFLKADIVGICRLPQSAVYSHDLQGNPIDINYQFAIVIVVGKDYQTLRASNGNDWITNSLSFQCYDRLAILSCTIASYIRRLGYPASSEFTMKPPRGYHVMFPPLLLWSGIGEVSRPGIILNPFLGLGYKAGAVLTNLPLEPDKPIDFGLQDFCQRCRICALACPSKAISMGEKIMYNGYETWKVDERRCASFCLLNSKGIFCGKCIKVCPWTRPIAWQHNLVRRAIKHSKLARRFAIRADNLLCRSRRNSDENDKWWFDLEEVDGVLRIPSDDTFRDPT